MSGPRVLIIIGVVIVGLFAVALVLSTRSNDAAFDPEGWVGGVRRTLTGAGRYEASDVPEGTPCFVNNQFRVQGTCDVVVPKNVRRIRLQVLDGQPRGVLKQDAGRLGYEVIDTDIETKDGGMAVDMKGDGGTLILICPTLCRMIIV